MEEIFSITCRATKKLKFHRYADMGWTLWDFRHRHTMILKAYINGHENVWKLWKGTQKCVNEFFTNLPPKTWKSMQYNSLLPAQFDIAKAKKKYSIHYLTGQNRGLSGLKNIWLVIMTGNLLSIILRINLCFATNFSQLVAKMRLHFFFKFRALGRNMWWSLKNIC